MLGSEMDPDKVMEDPVDVEALLEALFLFGIGVGFSAIGRTPSAQGGIEGFQMISMDRGILNRRRGLRRAPGGPDSLAACGHAYGRVSPCF